MQIRGEGLANEQGQSEELQTDRILYVVHPNCAVEEV
jgi:DNA replication licensing factor MCM6